MKTYKLWIEIEEYDDETDTYRDVTEHSHRPIVDGEGEAEPVPLGIFEDLDEAVAKAEALNMLYNEKHNTQNGLIVCESCGGFGRLQQLGHKKS
jgi:hypothetical protein